MKNTEFSLPNESNVDLTSFSGIKILKLQGYKLTESEESYKLNTFSKFKIGMKIMMTLPAWTSDVPE